MNIAVSSQEEILAATRSLMAGKNLADINIRDVAKTCGISVGSVYNYFSSKDDLLMALVEDIWKTILGAHMAFAQSATASSNFSESVRMLFESIRGSTADYPSFFTLHAASFSHADKRRGKKIMRRYFGKIQQGLSRALDNDKKIKQSAFDTAFTKETFIAFVFSNIIFLLSNGQTSCATLLQIIDRVVYLKHK